MITFKTNTFIGQDGKIHRFYSKASIIPALCLTTAIAWILAVIFYLIVR